MNRAIKVSLRRFQTKVTIAFVAAMVLAAFFGSVLVYRFSLKYQFEQLRNRLTLVAKAAALTIDVPLVERVMAEHTYSGTPAYDKLFATIRNIKRLDPSIASVYIFCKSNKEGFLEFVADSDLPGVMYNNKPSEFGPGKLYDARRFPALLNAFSKAGADQQIEADMWQRTLSGYAPLCNDKQQVVAIVGIDVLEADIWKMQSIVHKWALFVFLLSIIFSVLLGRYISRLIARPVQKLVEGIKHITEGNLDHQIDVKSRDEIGILADTFNTMARSLYFARKKLHDYFYNVMISFAAAIEEKDDYTRGHSERVANYCEKIAIRMGIINDKVDLFKSIAMLHDVGKISIASDILNKTSPLTESDWGEIRKHPAAGEKILRSIVLDPEMLSVIRSHHERVDGKGYPDHLKGDAINLFTMIVTVADAYDAMTSDRAYRKAFTQREAIDRLRASSGTQFDPKIVNVFIEILENEQVT